MINNISVEYGKKSKSETAALMFIPREALKRRSLYYQAPV